jgi:hypothetical protein
VRGPKFNSWLRPAVETRPEPRDVTEAAEPDLDAEILRLETAICELGSDPLGRAAAQHLRAQQLRLIDRRKVRDA